MRALEVNTGELEVGGDSAADVTQFSVKIDGHIFKMMTDGLYSAKVPSVVREILANAIDAQIKSGRDETVKVSLPTHFNATFRVRDFGDGMDHNFVRTLYTKLGHSTKRDDNTQTGFFGMGSKSPFTITDQFQITVFDGTAKRIYTAALATDGIPLLHFSGIFKSDEPSGVEVSVPVRSELIGEFETAVKASAFAYFDKNIEFNRDFSQGEHPLDWAKDNYKKIAEDVYVSREARNIYGSAPRVFIRQGFAVYPLELQQLNTDSGTTKMLRRLMGQTQSVYIDSRLGTFNVTASREKIQYDAPSKANLEAHLKILMARTVESIGELMKEYKTIREARLQLTRTFMLEREKDSSYEIADAIRDTEDVFPLFEDHVRANWLKYVETLEMPPAEEDEDGNQLLPKVPRMSAKLTVEETLAHPSAKIHTASSASFYYTDVGDILGGASFSKSSRVTLDTHCIVYVIPTAVRYWQERVFKHASEVVRKRFGKFRGTYRCDVHVFRTLRGVSDEGAEKLMARSDNVIEAVYREEDLPTYVPDKTTACIPRKTYSKTAVYAMKMVGSAYSWAWQKDKIEADQNEPAYYVTRNGIGSRLWVSNKTTRAEFNGTEFKFSKDFTYKPMVKAEVSNGDFFTAIEAARALGIIDPALPIYRVTERQRDVILEQDHPWVDLFETIINGALDSFKKYNVPTITSARAVISNAPVKELRVIKNLVDEIYDLCSAVSSMESGVKFFDASKEFLRNANLFGNRGMFEIIDAVRENDALALILLPSYIKHDGFKEDNIKTSEESALKTDVICKCLFDNRPVVKDESVLSDEVSRNFVLIMDDIALLNNLDYLHAGMGHHVARYLTASLNEGRVSSTKIPNNARLQALVKEMRQRFTEAQDKFVTYQKTAAITA